MELHAKLTLIFLLAYLLLTVLPGEEHKFERRTTYSSICLALTVISFAFLIFGNWKCGEEDWIYARVPDQVVTLVSFEDGKTYLKGFYNDGQLEYQYNENLYNGRSISHNIGAELATLHYDTKDFRVEYYRKMRKWLYFEEYGAFFKIYIPEGSVLIEEVN